MFLNPDGDDLNGFIFIRGDSDKLETLLSSEAWETYMTRAGLALDGFGCLRGVTGELLMKQIVSKSESYVRRSGAGGGATFP